MDWRRKFYLNAVVLLNLLALILFLIIAWKMIPPVKISTFKLMWACVSLALTVFIDISQKNVLRLINQKPVAILVVVLVLILIAIVILESSL